MEIEEDGTCLAAGWTKCWHPAEIFSAECEAHCCEQFSEYPSSRDHCDEICVNPLMKTWAANQKAMAASNNKNIKKTGLETTTERNLSNVYIENPKFSNEALKEKIDTIIDGTNNNTKIEERNSNSATTEKITYRNPSRSIYTDVSDNASANERSTTLESNAKPSTSILQPTTISIPPRPSSDTTQFSKSTTQTTHQFHPMTSVPTTIGLLNSSSAKLTTSRLKQALTTPKSAALTTQKHVPATPKHNS